MARDGKTEKRMVASGGKDVVFSWSGGEMSALVAVGGVEEVLVFMEVECKGDVFSREN